MFKEEQICNVKNKVISKVSNIKENNKANDPLIYKMKRDAYQQWASLFDITKSSNYISVLLLLYFFGSFYILIYKWLILFQSLCYNHFHDSE